MKKTLGKRLVSSVTSGVVALSYILPSCVGMQAYAAEAADGLPIIDTPYEETMWFRNNPLGIAGDFHLFAFDTIETTNDRAHINGNIAAPNYIVGSNHGQLNTAGTGRLLNVVRDSFVFKEGGDYDAKAKEEGSKEFSLGKMSDFFFPEDCGLSVKKGEYVFGYGYREIEKANLDYPHDASKYAFVRLDLPQSPSYFVKLQPGGEFSSNCYLAHAGGGLIDFEVEKGNYERRSENYAEFENCYADLKLVENPDYANDPTNQSAYIGTLTLNASGTNVLNFSADEADNYKNMKVEGINFKDGQFNDDQTLVVNIDLQGKKEFVWSPEWTYESAYDPSYKLVNSEESALSGTNIIYNFFNANSEGTKVLYNYGEKLEPWGCVLAPDCEVVPNNMSGTIIADKITLTNETHMAPFMNPVSEKAQVNISVKKTWDDDGINHDDDEVEVALYRSKKAGLVNVKDESYVVNRYEDFAEAVREAGKTDTHFSYQDGAAVKDVNTEGDSSIIVSKFGFGSEEPIFVPITDAVNSNLADGSYTFKKGAITYVVDVADGEIKDIGGSGIGYQELGSKKLNASNDWTASWENLDKTDSNGHTYFYYAEELNVPDGYSVEYTDNGVSGGNRTISVVNKGGSGGTPSKVSFAKYTDTMTVTEDGDGNLNSEYVKEYLTGAKLTLTAKDIEDAKLNKGTYSDQDKNSDCDIKYSESSITWTSINKPVEFYGLPNGLYKLTEEAPDGFQPVKETEIRIDNGNASVITADTGVTAKSLGILDTVIDIIDESFAVTVKKSDENGKPVQGAYFRLKGTSGENMKNVKAHDSKYFAVNGKGWSEKADKNLYPSKAKECEIENLASDGKSFEWYSTGSDVVFTGLSEGTYTVEEISAPAGYSKDSSKTFTVKRTDGILSADKSTIEFTDKKDTVKISKGDMGSVIIDGAEFVLKKKDGTSLGVLTTTDDSVDISEKVSKSHDALSGTSGIKIKDLTKGQKYTVRGVTFKNVTVDGKNVSSSGKNTYEYKGIVSDDTLENKGYLQWNICY